MDQQREKEKREAQVSIEQMVKEAELHKAEIYKPPGTFKTRHKSEMSQAEIDDDFFHSNSHVDTTLFAKIEKGEFVELHKLLPKEKILHDDGKLQLINKEGGAFFQSQTDKETPLINNVKCWESAFEVYATIYVQANPE